MAENLKRLKGQAVPQTNSPGSTRALSVKHGASVVEAVFLGNRWF